MLRMVWCRTCKLAWSQEVAGAPAIQGAVSPQAQPVRCPQCRCHRGVRFVPANEKVFREEHPAVRWQN